MVEFDELITDVEAGQPLDKAKMKASIRKARQTTILTPMLAEMHRRAKLRVKPNEIEGKLTFTVKPDSLLKLPPDAAPVRKTLFRRFEGLDASRVDDDAPYCRAVETGHQVTVVLPLPQGWRCHARVGNQECLHPNLNNRDNCEACATPKPKLKPEFQYLRLLSPSIRSESREYLRRIKESDSELTKYERYEKRAAERLAAAAKKQIGKDARGDTDEEDEEEELMLNVELAGVWNRVHASTVVTVLQPRKVKSLELLNSAKVDFAIVMQSSFELAAPHVQKVIRGFILRASVGRVREEAIELARFAAAVEIQRVVRSALATIEGIRRRKERRNHMATKIQCLFRKRSAYNERMRLFAIWIEQLQNDSAVKIQSIVRGYLCKVIAEKMAAEREKLVEEQERVKQANQEHEAAKLIQSHVRRRIAKMHCANRLVELGLHERLLLYIERFWVDGNFFDFMRSINDDYIRFERTITTTIEREEKLAQVSCEEYIQYSCK
jgi:hypothetical protein